MQWNDTWDLESIFTGGTQSQELQTKLTEIEKEIDAYAKVLRDWEFKNTPSSLETMKEIINMQEVIGKALGQSHTFIRMWLDAYMNDEHGNVVLGQIMQLFSEVRKLSNTYTKKLVNISDEDWNRILTDKQLSEVSFALNEIREDGKRLLSEAEEKLIAELDQDGLAAWSNLYDTVISMITIPFKEADGKEVELSVGQAMNRMYADPDPDVRKQLFANWEAAWGKYEPIFTDTINHLAGYRLTLQKAHGRTHHLEEPLEYNRMTKETLHAMWSAVSNNKQAFLQFLQQKAKLFKMEKLAWEDVDAPVSIGEFKPTRFTYNEACSFVLEHFASFGSQLTEFTKHALDNRWVEAEDRSNKRPGGYCTSLPEWDESRIFMTFTGSPSDVSTLAHELGHAFHSHVMRDLPQLNQRYAMNVAETASTFAETIIDNATVKNAKTKEEKIALLASKLEGATAMFLNIHSRFIFEDRFYTERAKGIVSAKRLNQLMEEAQKEAYADQLTHYHPHFWSSKLHFFIDSVPFYNFPYTFGYLFSLGIYAQYLQQPKGFEEKYIALLRDTGKMTVEDLAEKHLHVDLTKEEFWKAGIDLMAQDVAEFIELTNEYI